MGSVVFLVLLAGAASAPSRAIDRPGVRLAELTWAEAEKLLTPDRVVLLPLGAGSKEHGLHLLLGNDLILADYFAERVVAARPVALLPTLNYGFYPAFLEYPGSVSLSFATQRDVVAEICRSMARYGPRRFYVLNTGVSTARPLKRTVEDLAREGILLRFTDVQQAGHAAVDAIPHGPCAHADEIETSMLLYIRPAAVHMERAAPNATVYRAGPLTRDAANATGLYSPTGSCGDPSKATRQAGERIVEAMLADIVEEIDTLASAPLPPGTPQSPLEPVTGPPEQGSAAPRPLEPPPAPRE